MPNPSAPRPHAGSRGTTRRAMAAAQAAAPGEWLAETPKLCRGSLTASQDPIPCWGRGPRMSTPGSRLMAVDQGVRSSQPQRRCILRDPVRGVGSGPSCVLQWASCGHNPESACSTVEFAPFWRKYQVPGCCGRPSCAESQWPSRDLGTAEKLKHPLITASVKRSGLGVGVGKQTCYLPG